MGFLLFSCYGGYLTLRSAETRWKDLDSNSDFVVIQPTNSPTVIPSLETPKEQTVGQKDLAVMSISELDYDFEMQMGSPVAIGSWTHDCNWMGVAGQVFYDDNPINNIVVETGGSINGEDVFGLSLTGLFDEYGSGGYEIQLSDYPIESVDTVWIQIMDLDGFPLSQKIYFTSYDQCSQNLILVNFVNIESTSINTFHFPIIYR